MALSFKKEASEVVSPKLESTQDTLLAVTPKPSPVMEPIEDDDVVEASPLLSVVASPSPSPSQLKSNQHREDRERDDDEEDD